MVNNQQINKQPPGDQTGVSDLDYWEIFYIMFFLVMKLDSCFVF